MIIIETCPKCGYDLHDVVIATNPPIPKKECFNCGWYWEGEPEQVMRVPFGGNSFEEDKVWLHGNTDYEIINADCCMANNLAGNVFMANKVDLDNIPKINHYDIEAAIEKIQKYIKD